MSPLPMESKLKFNRAICDHVVVVVVRKLTTASSIRDVSSAKYTLL